MARVDQIMEASDITSVSGRLSSREEPMLSTEKLSAVIGAITTARRARSPGGHARAHSHRAVLPHGRVSREPVSRWRPHDLRDFRYCTGVAGTHVGLQQGASCAVGGPARISQYPLEGVSDRGTLRRSDTVPRPRRLDRVKLTECKRDPGKPACAIILGDYS